MRGERGGLGSFRSFHFHSIFRSLPFMFFSLPVIYSFPFNPLIFFPFPSISFLFLSFAFHVKEGSETGLNIFSNP